MISLLRLKNFKPFSNQSLSFRPLTLLSALNSTGKSSTLQALLLMRQSYQQGLFESQGLALNGELISIGTAQDALQKTILLALKLSGKMAFKAFGISLTTEKKMF